MYIDSHAHYDDKRFDQDRDRLLGFDLPKAGISCIINTGSSLASSRASVRLAEKYPYIYAAVGVHPHEASSLTAEGLAELKELCSHEKVVAVGEIGLDFHYDNSPRDVQRHWFKEQLALAQSLNMPVIIHSRDAAQETLDIIKAAGACVGVLHCYSGHLPMALEYIKLGFLIGIGGVVTYKNADKTKEVASGIPLDSLLIETDCPYLPPIPFRGQRNDSAKLDIIVEAIAQARGISKELVADSTSENARRLFGIH